MRNMAVVLILFSLLLNLSFAQDALDDSFTPVTTVGGYGDIHYNYQRPDGEKSSQVLDFHRFVLYFGHAWTEKWAFRSEIELEHNYVKGGQGELQLEQAFLEYRYSQNYGVNFGVVLLPIGLINENHEPTRFLSVERPDYAKNIIPTTWFGMGATVWGMSHGFEYRLTVMEGLDGSKFSNSSGIRSGRQKGYKANAEELLYNLRIDYTALPGLRAGGSYTYNNAFVTDSTNNAVTIVELHALYDANKIYAAFELGQINYATGDLQESFGYYADLGYDISEFISADFPIIPWVRWTDYNTASKTTGGGIFEQENHVSKWMAGISVKPVANVVLKADYAIQTVEAGDAKTTLFNLGAGYVF